MKNLTAVLVILLSTSIFASAQTITSANQSDLFAEVSNEKEEAPSSSKKKLDAKEMAELRQNAATKVSKLITQRLQYPSILEENCIEGKVLLEVTVAPTGRLEAITVLDSPNAEWDKAVAKLSNRVEGRKLVNAYAQKSMKFRVPLQFRMK